MHLKTYSYALLIVSMNEVILILCSVKMSRMFMLCVKYV